MRDNDGGYVPVNILENACTSQPVPPTCPKCTSAIAFWGKPLLKYVHAQEVFVCPSAEESPKPAGSSDKVWDSCPPPPDNGGSSSGNGTVIVGSGPKCPKIDVPEPVPEPMPSTYAYNAMVPHATAWANSPGARPTGHGFDRSAPLVTCMVTRTPSLPIQEHRVEQPSTTIMVVDSDTQAGQGGGGHVYMDTQLDYYKPPKPEDPRFSKPATIVSGRHNEGFNALFADGHVQHIAYGSSKPAQWTVQAD